MGFVLDNVDVVGEVCNMILFYFEKGEVLKDNGIILCFEKCEFVKCKLCLDEGLVVYYVKKI